MQASRGGARSAMLWALLLWALLLGVSGCSGVQRVEPAPQVEPEEAVQPAGGPPPHDAPGASTGAAPKPGDRLDPERLPPDCRVDRVCGALVGVDCGAAVDGPYFYVERSTGRVLEVCGGACMRPREDTPFCRACPPPEWTCP